MIDYDGLRARIAAMPLPKGWADTAYPTPETATDGTLEVSVADGEVTVQWEETRDDHWGTTSRSACFPIALIDALIARSEAWDAATWGAQ